MITVALVEDNDTVRQTLSELIENTPGYRCVCACATAKEAMSELPKARPEVALMDIHLPGESGIACTARLKAKMPDLHVIILTVYKDTELIFRALKAGASGYLLKRAPTADVLRAISDVKTGGAPMTSEIARLVVQSFQGAAHEGLQEQGLSPRESEILELLSEGITNKKMAVRLGISAETVRTHLGRIYEKLHVHGRTEAVTKYLRASGPA
ncbi:MAG TPA: response regulator transcription factor [Verrucomicrobiae bacterium]|jgi:DNA-binding NarL/FixJ family response regulator|nr:response regulator transcription factor [Verrucomicrobiae bacterium]